MVLAVIFTIIGLLTIIFPQKSYKIRHHLLGHKRWSKYKNSEPIGNALMYERCTGILFIILAVTAIIAYTNGFDLTNILNRYS